MRSFTTTSACLASIIGTGLSAYVPGQNWSTFTPSFTISGATTDFNGTFGIAVIPLTSTIAKAKRGVTAQPVTQIGDGQIQATTKTTTSKTTLQPVSQIGDGQIQATTKTSTAQPITQIGDGQIQATTATATPATQITDGQVQATSSTGSASPTATAGLANSNQVVACKSNGTLSMTLNGGILKDSHGRIGSIVANRQFQFDGPPPQAGAIYAAGWAIADGNLAIGNTTTFYQCLSGSFYNLYDESLGAQCTPVHLQVTYLVDC